jgi:TRAP-type C4-dicarboxylate transport system substrate-binding protein
VSLASTVAGATPITLHVATDAPDGTAWAREFRAFARDVDLHTHGEVMVKWYFGGIAGDELGVENRIKRGQVEAAASGGGLCQKLSPTYRAMRFQGVLQSHEEASWLLGHMRKSIEDELKTKGFVFLGGPVIGRELVFSRAPLKDLDALKRTRMYRWDVDEAGIALGRAAGLSLVPKALSEGAKAFDAGEIDGFLTIPAAVLAFQWTQRARYVIDWPHGYLMGCLIFAERAWDRLSIEQREQIRADAAKAIARVDDVSRDADERLLGGLFQRQGMTVEHISESLKKSLIAAMTASRPKNEIVDKLLEALAAKRGSSSAPAAPGSRPSP